MKELPVELYKEGYKKIVNIDFSETCIGNMTNRYKDGYDGTFLCILFKKNIF